MVRRTLAVTVALMVAATAYGQDLKVGMKAPSLGSNANFVQGSEVSDFKRGKTYVVEFWATWCGPCKRSIPHLNKMHKTMESEGLVIIGVSDEDERTVKNFLRKQGDRMSYRIVSDDRRRIYKDYMEAAGQRGIPCAFVVGPDGTIQHIGNPLMEEFDGVVKKVMRGRYNAKLFKQAAPGLEAARTARKQRDWKQAVHYMSEIRKVDPTVFADLALDQYEMMLLDMDDARAANAFARQVATKDYAHDAQFRIDLVQMIATDPAIPAEKRDLDLALEIANTVRLDSSVDKAQSLSLLAVVHHARGDFEQAIKAQQEAYFMATPAKKQEYKSLLAKYRRAEMRAGNE